MQPIEWLRRFGYTALILLSTAIFVWTANRNGPILGEEATMMDYSWVLKAARGSDQLRDQFAFWLQWTTIVPWGVLSWTTYLLGISTASHLILVSFVRLGTVHLIIYRLFRLRQSAAIAYLLSSAIVLLPPIRLAQNYSHWWAHVVLFTGLWILALDITMSYRHWKNLFVALLLVTLSVWTNLPHLVTAWLGFAMGLSQRFLEGGRCIDRKRLKFLTVSTTVIYSVPLATTAMSINVFGASARESLMIFGNQSISKVIQGFGGWWYFDTWCPSPNECIYYDLVNFRHFDGFRFAIRIAFFVVVVWNLLTSNIRSKDKSTHFGELDSASAVAILMIPLLMLSVLGRSSTYRDLLEVLPLMFSAIREPFAKFGGPFLICLYFSLGCRLSFRSTAVNRVLVSGILVAVAWLSLPELTRNDEDARSYYSATYPLSLSEWSKLDKAVSNFNVTSQRLCVIDQGDQRSRTIRARLGLKFPEKFTDLSLLRPLSINDAAKSNGLTLDRPSDCGRGDAALVDIRGKDSQSAIRLENGPCPITTNSFFSVYPAKCLARVRVNGDDGMYEQSIPIGTSWKRLDLRSVIAFRNESSPRISIVDGEKKFAGLKIRVSYFSRKNFRGDLSHIKEVILIDSGEGFPKVSEAINCITLNDECWYVIHSIEVSS